MPLKSFAVVICLVLTRHIGFAQAIDNQASFRSMNTSTFVRLHYDNDYFSTTDIYYTQGGNMEIVAPSLEKFPLSRLLIIGKENRQFGIAIEHNAYTPTSISHSEIL